MAASLCRIIMAVTQKFIGNNLFTITPSEQPLIDIGANLTNESFAKDLDQVVDRATQANVQHLILTGSDIENSHQALSLAEQQPEIFSATAGIHPHYADQYQEQTYAQLEVLLQHQKVCAVGETGLDFFRDISPREKQIESFEAHIELAAKNNMPMFLHQRDAHPEFLAILMRHRASLSDVVVHCFTDTAQALADYLALDCHIGITGWICDERRGAHLLDCVKDIPLNRLMIETDAPYLMPRTLRPKPKTRRNEPCNLPHVLASVADARPESINEIATATTENAQRFFNIRQGTV